MKLSAYSQPQVAPLKVAIALRFLSLRGNGCGAISLSKTFIISIFFSNYSLISTNTFEIKLSSLVLGVNSVSLKVSIIYIFLINGYLNDFVQL